MSFFVLSGLVLSLPFLGAMGQPYRVFAARRVIRIYGPYLGSLFLTIVCVSVWHGQLHRTLWASGTWSQTVDPKLAFEHVLFLGAYNFHQYNFVIWSLIYELRISLIFPLLIFAVVTIGDSLALILAITCSAVAFVTGDYPDVSWQFNFIMTVHYLAMFIIGILMAKNLGKLETYYKSLTWFSRATLALGSFILYGQGAFLAYVLKIDHLIGPHRTGVIIDWSIMLGAIGYIFLALNSPTVKVALLSPIPLFLGKISYSLYLTHVLVLFALTFQVGSVLPPWVQFLIYLPAALVCGSLFYYAVERPLTKASRRVGRGHRLANSHGNSRTNQATHSATASS